VEGVTVRVSVFGVCSDLGSDIKGSRKGAELLIPYSSKLLCLSNPRSDEDQEELHLRQLAEVASHVQALVADEIKPLMIGGDHSFTYPVLKVLLDKYPTVHLLHFDAHTDGNFNKQVKYKTPKHWDFIYHIKQSHPQLKITHVSSYPTSFLYGELVQKPNQIILDAQDAIYISIDVDCLVQSAMVSTGYPREKGEAGLTFEEILAFLHTLENRTLVGADLMEFGVEGIIDLDDQARAKALMSALESVLIRN